MQQLSGVQKEEKKSLREAFLETKTDFKICRNWTEGCWYSNFVHRRRPAWLLPIGHIRLTRPCLILNIIYFVYHAYFSCSSVKSPEDGSSGSTPYRTCCSYSEVGMTTTNSIGEQNDGNLQQVCSNYEYIKLTTLAKLLQSAPMSY